MFTIHFSPEPCIMRQHERTFEDVQVARYFLFDLVDNLEFFVSKKTESVNPRFGVVRENGQPIPGVAGKTYIQKWKD